MRLILVNTKQKIAVLATGLAIATTGFVAEAAPASPSGAPGVVVAAGDEAAADERGASRSEPSGALEPPAGQHQEK